MNDEIQRGFKRAKLVNGIEFVASLADVGGGYDEDPQFSGYRQTI